ncbi:stromal cell-derived factor 1 isoform X1 [Aquarana catesbeiana]|uniref:stromal cell-derived factor 1 isoform X1 n=1 Tax=Aquarana catesbeiana TaxID=8400 RepID=UPI003CCA3122
MDLSNLAILTLLLGTICLSDEKPVSLTYRCPCRYFETNVAKSNIKHLKILSTTNCSLQIVARLKHNGKQICLDPKIKWIQEYLEKALNKRPLTEAPMRLPYC